VAIANDRNVKCVAGDVFAMAGGTVEHALASPEQAAQAVPQPPAALSR